MKRPLDAYGDNFPVAEGLYWSPKMPWRHGHVTPSPAASWWFRIGWWTVVAALMGLLVLLAVHEGFSAETAPANRPATVSSSLPGELIVQFHEGVIRYPDGVRSALLHEVQFRPQSLQQLNARFGLIAVERVVNPTQPTQHTFKLVFATRAGLGRTLLAYQHDPAVVSAELVSTPALRRMPQEPVNTLYTRDA